MGYTQQTTKIPKVGILQSASAEASRGNVEAFQAGLRELGYEESKNIVLVLEYRAAEDRNQIAALAAELSHLRVDVIVTQGTATRVVKPIITNIPVVFAFSGDPVEAGFVDSLARPATNFTGMSFMAQDLAGKRIELLKEAVPRVSRIAIISTRTHPGEKNEFNETQVAARGLKTELQYLPVTNFPEIDSAFEALVKHRAEAILTFPDAVTLFYRSQLADFATKRKLPSMFGWKQYVDAGGLISYGPNLDESFRRLAVFVDKIFKGVNAAELPVEQPTKFEFVINLKTAKQIGLTIPPNVLARADKVIK